MSMNTKDTKNTLSMMTYGDNLEEPVQTSNTKPTTCFDILNEYPTYCDLHEYQVLSELGPEHSFGDILNFYETEPGNQPDDLTLYPTLPPQYLENYEIPENTRTNVIEKVEKNKVVKSSKRSTRMMQVSRTSIPQSYESPIVNPRPDIDYSQYVLPTPPNKTKKYSYESPQNNSKSSIKNIRSKSKSKSKTSVNDAIEQENK
jgi:hypothetical protein